MEGLTLWRSRQVSPAASKASSTRFRKDLCLPFTNACDKPGADDRIFPEVQYRAGRACVLIASGGRNSLAVPYEGEG
jgi:hypothetical protein